MTGPRGDKQALAKQAGQALRSGAVTRKHDVRTRRAVAVIPEAFMIAILENAILQIRQYAKASRRCSFCVYRMVLSPITDDGALTYTLGCRAISSVR
jgi:hypothetical protein